MFLNKSYVYISLSLLLLSFVVYQCKSPNAVESKLLVAEQLMSERPDSSLAVLSQLSFDSIGSDSDRALYALLMTQAKDKNYLPDTNDSLINVAISYYDATSDDERRMWSHFYRAQILQRCNRYSEAIADAILSLSIAEENNDYFAIAKNQEFMADVYHWNYHMADAIMSRRKAYLNYVKAGKDNFARYAVSEIAAEVLNEGKYRDAIALLDSITPLLPEDDLFLKAYTQSVYIMSYYRLKEYTEAIKHFHAMRRQCGDAFLEEQELGYAAMAFVELDEPDSAEFYLKKNRSENPQCMSKGTQHLATYKLAKYRGNLDTAIVALERTYDLTSTAHSQIANNRMALNERDYYLNKFFEVKYKNKISQIVGVCVLILIIIAVVSVVLIIKNRRARRLIETEALLEQLNIASTNAANSEDMLDMLFKSHFSELNDLWIYYYRIKEYGKLNAKDVDNINIILKNMNSEDYIEKVSKMVDYRRDGIIKKMRSEVPELSTREFNLITLRLAGLSPRVIAMILGVNQGNYYNIWTRLCAKIQKSDSPQANYFIEQLKQV